MKTIDELKQLDPCSKGLDWASKQPSLYEAWESCERSDWMWWILQKLEKCPKELSVKYSQWCADSVKHLRGMASSYVFYASYASSDAASSYAYAADAASSDAASSDVANASYAANAANAASYAYTYGANASDADAYAADARRNSRKQQAVYLRSIISNPFER